MESFPSLDNKILYLHFYHSIFIIHVKFEGVYQLNFPTQSHSQKMGRAGESRWADFVVNSLGCIYHKIDGSDDFGLDGHIELVDDGLVTGKLVAMQVKHGDSYFSHKTSLGYKYIAKDKYLNYYLNAPSAVFIVIMSGDFSEMLWVKFDIQNIFPYGKNSWWIEIPNTNNLLSNFKQHLFSVAGRAFDYSETINYFKTLNLSLNKADNLTIGISKKEVDTLDFTGVLSTFSHISKNVAFRNKFRSSCSVCFPQYTDDPRELYQIPEVVCWIRQTIELDIPWFYFLSMDSHSGIKIILLSCVIVESQKKIDNSMHVQIDNESLSEFLITAFLNLNTFTEKYGVNLEINKELSKKIAKFLVYGLS